MMTAQGFPLWAMEFDGTAYVVVGWSEQGYPYLLPTQERATGPQLVLTGETFTYTTTDPTAQAFSAELISTDPDTDLRQRLTALADELEVSFRQSGAAHHAAARIRDELAK